MTSSRSVWLLSNSEKSNIPNLLLMSSAKHWEAHQQAFIAQVPSAEPAGTLPGLSSENKTRQVLWFDATEKGPLDRGTSANV